MSKKMEEQQKYIDIINEIDECYALMKKVRPLSASELKYFNNEFSISATHNSNAIEGNTFTFDETKLLIEKGIVTVNRREYPMLDMKFPTVDPKDPLALTREEEELLRLLELVYRSARSTYEEEESG